MKRIVMNKGISWLLVSTMALFIGINITAQTNQKDVSSGKKGIVTYTDGRVKKKQASAPDWQDAEKNSLIISGDRVRTYKRSRAELELLELDIIRMAPETTIDIVKLYDETKSKVKETKLNLEEGNIWAKIGKKDTNMKFDISTPVAAAAITGTVFRMGVENDSTTELKVYTGEVHITNAPEKTNLQPTYISGTKPTEVQGPHEVPGPREVSMNEWLYIVKNMQKIQIAKDGTVKEIGNFSATDRDEQTDWVKWNLQRDRLKGY